MNKIGKSYIFIKYSLSNLSKIIRYIWIEKKYPRHANIKHEFLALKRINLKFSYSSNMYTFTNSCSKQPSKVSRLLVALLLTVTTNNNYHERGLIFVTVNIAPRVYPIGFPILDKFPPYPHANPPPPSSPYIRTYTHPTRLLEITFPSHAIYESSTPNSISRFVSNRAVSTYAIHHFYFVYAQFLPRMICDAGIKRRLVNYGRPSYISKFLKTPLTR